MVEEDKNQPKQHEPLLATSNFITVIHVVKNNACTGPILSTEVRYIDALCSDQK
jgi:hypothetical protein